MLLVIAATGLAHADSGQLVRAAHAFAAQGRCDLVVEAATRLRALDPAASDELARDRDIAACLPQRIERRESYRASLAIGDVAGIAIGGLGGALSGRDAFGALLGAAIGLVAGPMVVHLAEGNPAGATYSVILRAALPALGAVTGALAFNSHPDDNATWRVHAAIGGAVGAALAIALDYAFLPFRAVPVIEHTPIATVVGVAARF